MMVQWFWLWIVYSGLASVDGTMVFGCVWYNGFGWMWMVQLFLAVDGPMV
jgi:hypothetical protein